MSNTDIIDSLPEQYWPFSIPIPSLALYTVSFQTLRLTKDSASHYGIVLPESLADAANKRKAEFLAGRLCAREAIGAITGTAVVPAMDAQRIPVWPENTCGSITHSKNRAAAVAGACHQWQSLGIDMETLLEPSRANRLQETILTTGEIDRWQAQSSDRNGFLVTLAFSLKESLFKALFPLVRKRFYFQQAELVEWSEQGQARLRLLTDLSPQWCQGREVTAQFSCHQQRILSLVTIPV